jgi:hypothetical protein
MKRKTKIVLGASIAFAGLLYYALRKPRYTFVDTGVWCDDDDCSNIDDMTAENYIEYCEEELGYDRAGRNVRTNTPVYNSLDDFNSNNPITDTQSCTVGQENKPTTRDSRASSGWTNILLDGPYAQDFNEGEEVYIEQDEESQVYPAYNGTHKIMKTKGDYVVQIDVMRQGNSMPVGGKIFRKAPISRLLGE